MISGEVVGYDPGGDGTHGIAILRVENGAAISLSCITASTVEDVISRIASNANVLAFGIDTLTCWSTGRCGWRPADRWLRDQYPIVRNSIVSPNGLYGSMGLNGMAILLTMRAKYPGALITETHPKVLYHQLSGLKYDWSQTGKEMTESLVGWLGAPIHVQNDHEWDAALSAYSAFQGLCERWSHDLHALPVQRGEQLVEPAGKTHYFWPTPHVV